MEGYKANRLKSYKDIPGKIQRISLIKRESYYKCKLENNIVCNSVMKLVCLPENYSINYT
jgi:hypothetical protein